VTSIGSLDYTWDWRNRLSSAERSGGGTTSFGYDHTGQRVFNATGTATTSYPNMYFNTDGSTITKHIFGPDGTLLAVVSSPSEGMRGSGASFAGVPSSSEEQGILSQVDSGAAAEAANLKAAEIANSWMSTPQTLK
jgi:hypothetical protein